MRARGQWTRDTRGDPAELPRRLDAGYERDDERRLPCRGTETQEQNKKLFKKRTKQNEVKGRRLRLGSGLLVTSPVFLSVSLALSCPALLSSLKTII